MCYSAKRADTKGTAMALSKTQAALALVRQGVPVKKAAELAGVAEATIYIAQNRLKGKEQCPCCGQVVREGFEINRDVLKSSGT
jgi:transposase-like protein